MTTATQTKPDKNKKILDELRVIKQKRIVILEQKDRYKTTHLWEFFRQFDWQANISAVLKRKMIVLVPAPNGIGKTAEMVNTLCSWGIGYEAWSPVEEDYPDAVKHDGVWYKPSSLGIKPPVRLRLTGEDWNHHLGQVVVPEMEKWFPMDDWDTVKNTARVKYFWTHKKTGSTIELMTHDQDLKLFESWRGHGWAADEPPKYGIFKAMSRGLAENRGKMLFLTTPLREAWMLDELVLKNRSDVGVMTDLTLFDNEVSYNNDNRLLDELGLTGKRTKYWREADGHKKTFFDLILRSDLYMDLGEDGADSGPPEDQGQSAEKFLRENVSGDCEDVDGKIMQLIFLKKAKDTSEDEKPSRFFGMFKKLVGLVVKEFKKDRHVIRAEKEIPTNWVVSFQVDWHLGKPHAIAFYAWDERNVQRVIDEVWENMTAEQVASLIIRRKKVNCWNISYGEIDPLSKGDHLYMKNRDADAVSSFTIIKELLEVAGIELEVASKDKKSGFLNIKSMLKGVNGLPTLFFLDSLRSVKDNLYGVVHEIQRLCYDDNGEVEKKDDHFMECLYRSTNMGIEYREPVKRRVPVGSGTEGGWLGT